MARNKVNLGTGNITVNRKKSGFTQIYNEPVQNDLEGLQEIGLLTYLLSLPDDWQIRKTHLQSKFKRRSFDNAWKALVDKQYALDISFYAEGYQGRLYFYAISDEKYNQESLDIFVKNVVEHLKKQGLNIKPDTFKINGNLDIPAFLITAQSVQYSGYSTQRTTTNKELQRTINKEINTSDNIKIVNKELNNSDTQDLKEPKQETKETSMQEVPVTNKQESISEIKNDFINICNSFYLDFSLNHWTKKEWITLVNQYVTEIMETERYKEIKYRKNYVYSSLQKITSHSELKNESDEEREDRINSVLQGLIF